MAATEHGDGTGTPIRVWMEVDLDANPIQGTLRTPEGSPSSFTGWLGLTTALDGMRTERVPAEGERSEARGSP